MTAARPIVQTIMTHIVHLATGANFMSRALAFPVGGSDVTLGEPLLLACLAKERLRHAYPGAGILTTTAMFGTGGTPAAITDGGGGAAMLRMSNRSATSSGRSAGRSAPNTNGALRADLLRCG